MPTREEMIQGILEAQNRTAPQSVAPNRSQMIQDILKNQSESKKDIPEVYTENVNDEIPASSRAALSFASNDAEKLGYLRKAYPGIEFGKLQSASADQKDPQIVVKMPGESNFRYIDKPGFTVKDLADFAGDVPSVATSIGAGILAGPAAIPAAAAGAGAGEVLKKSIGRGLIGIPSEQSIGEDVGDVALATGLGAATQFGLNKIPAIKSGVKQVFNKVRGGAVKEIASAPIPNQVSNQVSNQLNNSIPQSAGSNFVQKVEQKALPPKSAKELVQRFGEGSKNAAKAELPTAKRLIQIQNILPDLENPPLPIHQEMVKNKTSQSILALRKELPDEIGLALNNYEQIMKKEAESKVGEIVQKASKRPPLPRMEAGEEVLNSVTQAHQSTKEMLKPLFEQFNNTRLPITKIAPDVRNRIASDIPKLGPYLESGGQRQLILAPFSPKMGITEQAYLKLQTAIRALNGKKTSFRDLQNIREYLRQSIDPVNPKATQVLQDVRKSLLSSMEEWMAAYKPKSDVRAVFKQYALNESKLEQMERILGGKLENFNQLEVAKVETVLNRIFSDRNKMRVAREVVGEQKFGSITGDYINSLIQQSTDKGIFSSAKFSSAIRQKKDLLKEALGPVEFDRLEALVDLMRIVPDAPSPNPSGTAKATGILRAMTNPRGSVQKGIDKISGLLEGRKATIELNAILQNVPKSQRPGLLKSLSSTAKKPGLRQAAKGLLVQEGAQTMKFGNQGEGDQ